MRCKMMFGRRYLVVAFLSLAGSGRVR